MRMIRQISIIFSAVLYSVSITGSSPPANRLRYGNAADAFSMERINHLLRKTGTLLRGPLILPDIPLGASHVDDGLESPIEAHYFLPLNFTIKQTNSDQNPQTQNIILTKIRPPPKRTNEPNYYARKQRKYPKKFTAAVKYVNIKPEDLSGYNVVKEKPNSIPVKNTKKESALAFDDDYFGSSVQLPLLDPEHYKYPSSETYRTNHDGRQYPDYIPVEEISPEDDDDITQENVKVLSQTAQSAEIGHGDGNSRIEYQVHGFDGPKSYRFGYDTGKGKERHFRFEERNQNGEIKGQYGYSDKDGKFQIVKYTSDSERGFQVEQTPIVQ